ncbi:lipase family protein [Nannocystis pusilla]|uniref:lipase family protein n=1 Tax=Nannocystis pusilla TaxID=889268 RepID=UPI003DA6A9D6
MATSVTPFDPWQQVYCLSRQSNLIGNQNRKDTTDNLAKWLGDQLTNFYTAYKEQMGGTWSTVWGPVVFDTGLDATLQIADNVMYVAANHDRSMFVVAIAGTNFNSLLYDVGQEDDAVDKTVTWAEAFPSLSNSTPPGLNPYLSAGTALGVNNLLGMTDGKTGKTLKEFLASATSTSTTLVFSGHSLGGALAPTLALALFNSQGGQLSKSDWANVYFYPTAGPTPGNGDLFKYVAQEFKPVDLRDQPWQCWNRVVWNSLDAVPQGWVVELLQKLPELYPHTATTVEWGVTHPWPPKDLQSEVDGKVKKSQAGSDTGAGPYTQLANRSLPGTPFDDGKKCIIPVKDKDSYTAQMGYQHTTAYDVLFKVESVSPSQSAPGPASRPTR